MSEDIARLRELAQKATAGPWTTRTGDYVWAGDDTLIAARDEERDFAQAAADIEFIATANPQTILSLLDALESTTQRAEAAEGRVITALRAALESTQRAERLHAALLQWKCPSCGGSRKYTGFSRTAPAGGPCRKCEKTDGLHPIAYAALTQLKDT